MGAIHFSIDPGLIRALQSSLPLDVFVETGTFDGASVEAAKPFFKKLHTVEFSEELYSKAAARFSNDSAVEVLHGDSPGILKKLRPKLENESVLYWLDAHWCLASQPTAGEKSQCPLLQELDAIHSLNEKSVILIDDARLFLSVPPAPHETSDWPDFDSVVRKLFAVAGTHALSVVNDVITCVPRIASEGLREYAKNNSPDLLVILDKATRFDLINADHDMLAGHVARLSGSLETSEADRAERLRTIGKLDELLKETNKRLEVSETDRAERLRMIEKLDQLLKETNERLQVSDTDRAARLAVIERQQVILEEMESRLKALQGPPDALRKPPVQKE